MQPPASPEKVPETGPRQLLPEFWLDQHGDALYRYALVLVADEHQAEDLVQDTLIAAFEGRDRFQAASTERTWLIAILRNKAIDLRRRSRREQDYLASFDPAVEGNFNKLGQWRQPPKSWVPNPSQLLESGEFWKTFDECLQSLPGSLRETFSLRVLEGVSAGEVCQILEISNANLWTQLHRARERLRRCLETKWFKPETS